jgi:hypothetical protein
LLVATYPQIEERSLLGSAAPQDPMTRLGAVAEELTRQIVEYEPELCTHLRLSLEPARNGFRGRRIPNGRDWNTGGTHR